MSLEPALFGYAGLALLAGVRGDRHHLPLIRSKRAARIMGVLLLVASFAAALLRHGRYQGPVAWIGLVSLGGLALVLLMSRWRRTALRLWLPAALTALLIGFV